MTVVKITDCAFGVLVNTTSTFKFLVSSVPFTQNWQWDQFDTWGGFMAVRVALSALMIATFMRATPEIDFLLHFNDVIQINRNVKRFWTLFLMGGYRM